MRSLVTENKFAEDDSFWSLKKIEEHRGLPKSEATVGRAKFVLNALLSFIECA